MKASEKSHWSWTWQGRQHRASVLAEEQPDRQRLESMGLEGLSTKRRQRRAGGARRPGTSGWCGLSAGKEAHPPPLSPESALDDLDLNEFGVAALEKTFDNSTVPHPGGITIGTGQRVGGMRGRAPRPRVGMGCPLLVRLCIACPALTGPPGPLFQVAVCCRALRP